MRAEYAERRDVMLRVLAESGFEVASPPAGAYYVMADCSHLGLGDDVATARHLVEHVGVAAVPGSSFVEHAADGAHLLRFAFCKRVETLEAAGERLVAAFGSGEASLNETSWVPAACRATTRRAAVRVLAAAP